MRQLWDDSAVSTIEPGWRKASFCASRECLEVGQDSAVVAVRDTRDRGTGPVLAFPPSAWQAFTAALKAS